MEYKYRHQIKYVNKGRLKRFSLLTNEEWSTIYDLIFVQFADYVNQKKPVKVSKNNIIKFLKSKGVDCVDRKCIKKEKVEWVTDNRNIRLGNDSYTIK